MTHFIVQGTIGLGFITDPKKETYTGVENVEFSSATYEKRQQYVEDTFDTLTLYNL